MSSKTDLHQRCAFVWESRFSVALALAGLLSACSSPPAAPAGQRAVQAVPLPPPVQQAISPAPVPNPPPAPAARPAPLPDPTARVLAYAERVRQMPVTELNAEIARLNEVRQPVEQAQLALALLQLRQLPDLARAQDVLGRLLISPEAEALHPLARVIASRLQEQRRAEEQLERQAQQLRDTQRRLDQTSDRLEALKAIERSLGSRQPAAQPPASSGRQPRSTP